MEKDHQKLNQLARVQNQLQKQAKLEIEHIDKIKKRIEQKETKCMMQILRAQESLAEKADKTQQRVTRV